MERAFGFRIISEVSSASVLLYVFPVFIIFAWQYSGTSYGIAAIYLSAICALYWVTPSAPDPGRRKAQAETSRAAWLGLTGLLIALSGVTGFWAFVERIGNSMGATPAQIGITLAILKAVGGMAGFTAVLAGSKFGLRWPHFLAMALIVSAMALLQIAEGLLLYVAGLWLWEFGFTLAFGYQCSLLARLDQSGRSLLFVPGCLGMAGVIGPGLAGYLKSGESYFNIYCFAAICAVVSSTIFLMIVKKQHKHISTKDHVAVSA